MAKLREFFGFGTGEKPQSKREGQKPLRSLFEIPELEQFRGTLQERLAGRGVGFRPEIISGATAPFARARRAAVREVEAPAISAEASARGLGRSTIPISQIARRGTLAERDIEQRIASLSLADEQQRRLEINAALQSFGQLGIQEFGAQNVRRLAEGAEFERILGQRQAQSAQAAAFGDKALTAALAALTAATGGATAPLLAAKVASGTRGISSGATIEFGGEQLDPDDLQRLLLEIQRG